MESAPVAGSITFEVPVEHGHRTEAESLDSLQTFSGEVERITRITDEDVTAEEVSIAVARLLEELCGMFERREVIRSVVSEENLLRLDLLEKFDVLRLEKFSLNAAPKVRSVLLTFEHIKDSANVSLRATEQIIVQNDPAISNGKLTQSSFTCRNGAEPAVIMTAARRDSVTVLQVQARSKCFPVHPRSWGTDLDRTIARPSVSESRSFQQIPSESDGDMNLRDVIRNEEPRQADSVE